MLDRFILRKTYIPKKENFGKLTKNNKNLTTIIDQI